jgi:hypothetical protein
MWRGEISWSSAAREGERKQVTVLFADLKGSMVLAFRTAGRISTADGHTFAR